MTTIYHQIKHFYTGNVLFQCELTDQESSLATRHALERAVTEKINLRDADLIDATVTTMIWQRELDAPVQREMLL